MARIRAVLVRRRFGEDGRMRGKVTAVPTTQQPVEAHRIAPAAGLEGAAADMQHDKDSYYKLLVVQTICL